MQKNRGYASKSLTLLIVVLGIAFTVAAYLASIHPASSPAGDYPASYYGVGVGE